MLHMARSRVLWACLGLAVVLSACDGSPEAQANARLEKAQEYALAGDTAAAIIELKSALTDVPDNANARALLGELYFRSGDPVSAIKELLRAREQGQQDDKLRLLLAEARLQTGEYQAILDDVAADQAMADDIGAGLMAARGQAQFSLGQFDEAKTTLEKVVASRPIPASYAGLARIALFRGDPAKAGQYVDEGLGKYPNDDSLKLLHGDQQMQAQQFEAARTTFDELAKADPNNLMAGIGLARAELALGRTEPARVVIDDLLEKNPQNPGVVLLRSIAALQAHDFTAAQQDANAVRAVDEANPTALYIAGASSYALEQYEQALRALARYVAVAPNDPAGRKLLAATQVRMGDPGAARRTLGDDVGEKDPQYLALMSTVSALSGDIGSGMEYLERAILQSPDDARLRARLGLLRVATGDLTQGASDLDQALGIDPSIADDPNYDRGQIVLIQRYLLEGKFDEAMAAIEQWKGQHPNDSTGFVLEGVARANKGDRDAARAAFGKALELRPGAPDASANLAILELQAGNPKGAELILEQALGYHPDNLKTLLLLAQLSAQTNDVQKTRGWLERAVTAHPDSLETRMYLARLYFDLREPDKSLEMVDPVVAAMPDNPAALEVKARAEMETGRLDDAVATYQSLIKLAPNAAQPKYELSQAYMALGKLDEARAAAEAAVAADSRHAAARLLLARILLRQEDAASAESVVADLVKEFPNAADVKEIEADLAMLKNDPQRALVLYRDARKIADSRRLAAAEARALAESGDQQAAAATLEQWIERNPRDTAARLELNRYYQAADRTADAEANLRAIIDYEPDNALARNDLAWMLYQAGDLAAALPEAERALKAAPESPVVMDTLGVILLDLGEVKRSIGLLRRANDSAPDNPSIGFHLARAYALGDDQKQARDMLAALLEKHPSFAEREQAATLLAQLGG